MRKKNEAFGKEMHAEYDRDKIRQIEALREKQMRRERYKAMVSRFVRTENGNANKN